MKAATKFQTGCEATLWWTCHCFLSSDVCTMQSGLHGGPIWFPFTTFYVR